MSFTNDEELNRFLHHEHAFPNITADSLSDKLAHFPLPRANGKDFEWLGMAIRRALGLSIRAEVDGPNRQSNTDTRKELDNLGKRAGKLWLAMFDGISHEGEDALWRFAHLNWNGEGGTTIDGLSYGDPAEMIRFRSALKELDWLSQWLRRGARQIPTQQPRWTEKEHREIRIFRALCLAPIYLAFYRTDKLSIKPFGDFYQRIAALAFDEDDIPDFESIISDARKIHGAQPTVFAADFIPGL
ncbi:hypothetical protein [uncultured Parasphingorhabdus sp.]|uniref:hypothetical protein n=1 Tax=uncultured Parasphingorhabdus sp. TaxID=2709694 RepID=UPI0030D6E4F0|tara:strand:+ start:74722 stop:75450 length:729 start_codon:yes stop_codon:yes gene_type:complete